MTYQKVFFGGVVSGVKRARDDVFVPADPGNADWREYLTWVSDGNIPDEPPTVPDPVPAATPEQLVRALAAAFGKTPDEIDALIRLAATL